MVGIYKITNLIDKKVYIGQSKNLKSRLDGHKSCLKHNHHSNIYLHWIDYYGGMNSNDNYNFKEASSPGKMSDITKQKMSIAKLGTKREPWVCEKLSQSFKGRPGYWKGKHPSEKTKEKLRQLHLGKKQTPEHIKNATEARIRNGSYENLKYNKERSQKIKDALTGRKTPEETKKKISESITLWWKERKENGSASSN